MIKKLKRILASALVCSFVTSNFTMVYANKQAQVEDITIRDNSPQTIGSTNYKLNFTWTEPVSYEMDTDPNVSEPSVIHKISEMPDGEAGYDIYFRNTTKNEAEGGANQIHPTELSDPMSIDISKQLIDSSIYSFTVLPWHVHRYVTTNPTTGVSNVTIQRAPYATDEEKIETLYLTDIKLEAESQGKDVTFKWKNPTYQGKTVFPAYRIYYDLVNDSFFDVSASDLEKVGDTFTITKTVQNITYGKFYDAKIEPLVINNGAYQELRKMTKPEVVIEGETYPIGFTNREYIYEGIYLTPSIRLDDISANNLQLSWDAGDYSKIEIYKSTAEGQEESIDGYTLMGTLSGTNAGISSYILEKPTAITYYKIIFYLDNNAAYMISDFVVFDPSYKEYEPYMPKIYKFKGEEETSNPKLNTIFNAFYRYPITQEEIALAGGTDKLFVDKDVTYNVWITDNADNFNDTSFEEYRIASLNATNMNAIDYEVPANSHDAEAGKTVKAYEYNFGSYVTYENGEYVEKPTVDGKLYYIKIESIRRGGDTSKTAQSLTYVKPLTDNISNPITITNPPLRLELDENEVPIKTKDSFNIEWQQIWNEAYDYETELWYAVIGVNEAGEIVFGKDETDALDNQDNVIKLYEGEYFTGNISSDTTRVLKKLKALGADTSSLDYQNFVMRKSNLGVSEYEIFVTSFENMEVNGGYESYLNKNLLEDDVWRSIAPDFENQTFNYTVKQTDDPQGQGLNPATSYVVYIRSYIIGVNGEKIYSYNPGYIIGETLSERDDIPVTPPTIILQDAGTTQNSVTFEFEYTDVFEYEVRFSNKLANYPDAGITISNDELLKNGEIITNDDGTVVVRYTIHNLAPETKYYTWIKAIYGDMESAWSLPLEQKTLQLIKPEPPRSIGLMDDVNVGLVNQTNGTEFINPNEDYFIIDFARVKDDRVEHESGITQSGDGSYIFEQLVPLFPGALFTDLVPNQKYHVRVKTILKAIPVDEVYVDYIYSYEVQISESARFEEVKIVYVFDDATDMEGDDSNAETENGGIVSMESDWSKTVIVKTGKTDSEYDGDKDDILYPIPDSNYEIIVEDDSVIFVYRGSGKDSEGKDNNLTDQRLISDIIENGSYNLVADLSRYDNLTSRPIREVRLPYRLVKGLSEYKVDFTLKAQDTYLTTSFKDIEKLAKTNNLKDFGNDSTVSIKLANKTGTYTPYIGSDRFITPAEKIIMMLETPTRSVRIQNTYEDIELAFAVKNRVEYETNNINVLMFDEYGNKKTVPHTYDIEYGTMNIKTKKLSTYGGVRQGSANTKLEPDHYYRVSSKLNITDLRPYNGNAPVYALHYNNVVSGIARNKTEITMKDAINQEDYTALGRSGLLISGDKIKREDAIVSLTKLYELKTGNKIDLNIYTGTVKGIDNVSSKNKEYIAKANQIGLYYEDNANFTETLNFDEFFYMLDLIVE